MELYYAPYSPPSRTVRLAAEYIGVNLNLHLIDIFKGEHMTPEFEEINPERKVPILIDGDFKISESRAIMVYLVEKYGNNSRILPSDPHGRGLVNMALQFDIGTLFKRMREYYFPVIFGKESPSPEKYEMLKEAFGILDKMLESHDYVAGRNITIADMSLITTVTTAQAMGFDGISKYKNISAWLDRAAAAIPGYRRINLEGLEAMKQAISTNAEEQ